ncbi:RNA polymerase sigma factor [Jannaschia pagri]|uniref:RNA polymerase sigma factor n=1 Tax=Jannaschia pagri TaxID=2829797 RepID=A0ABQ4NHL2_9RHOB|nr:MULTISPECIES: RNA polymerase sigma factor [unclassified Jannaschia]GIT89998.1 RNA polymerase sigma factor [Jannaschia sp. AI_61]GIT93896.1 RNA polymerase sigma factor [Jannaschia sp. AI_62]
MEDRDLLKRIASGDTSAMRVFFERYEASLFAFLRSRGADTQTADDVVQDAMLAVWRTAGSFRGTSRVKTWLFAIGRNKLIDRQRRGSHLQVVEDVPDTADDAPNAEALLIAAQDAERVRACLDRLKPHHLTAMRLAFYEDMTYAEIAEIEGRPEGTIKARVHYAKQLLMRCLGKR